MDRAREPPVTMTIKGIIIHHNKFDAMKMKVILVVVLFCHLYLISGGRKYLVQIENKVEV